MKRVRQINPAQVLADAERRLTGLDDPVAQAALADVRLLGGIIRALQEALIGAMEREAVAQANRAIAERELSGWKKEAAEKGREYVARMIGGGLDMDAGMVDVVLRWMEGETPADVPPFFINQLREALREVRDIVAYERGEDEDIA